MALEFHNALKAHAKNFPDKAAIIDGETTVSYGELLEKAEKFAGGLDSLNLGPKSKMAILSVNQNEFLIALLGSFIKGIPVVPCHISQNCGGNCIAVSIFKLDDPRWKWQTYRCRVGKSTSTAVEIAWKLPTPTAISTVFDCCDERNTSFGGHRRGSS